MRKRDIWDEIHCQQCEVWERNWEREWWKAASVVYNSAEQRLCLLTEAPLIFIPISLWCMKGRDRRLTNASIQSNAVLLILKASSSAGLHEKTYRLRQSCGLMRSRWWNKMNCAVHLYSFLREMNIKRILILFHVSVLYCIGESRVQGLIIQHWQLLLRKTSNRFDTKKFL